MVFIVFFLMIILTPAASHALLSMSVDGTILDFRIQDPGSFTELKDKNGDYQTEVTCSSTNGKTWYLKTRVLMPFRSGPNTIQAQNFKWMITSAENGRGTINNVNQFNDFAESLNVMYTSDPADNTGNQIKIKVRYGLNVPEGQVAGTYNGTVRFVLIETL